MFVQQVSVQVYMSPISKLEHNCTFSTPQSSRCAPEMALVEKLLSGLICSNADFRYSKKYSQKNNPKRKSMPKKSLPKDHPICILISDFLDFSICQRVLVLRTCNRRQENVQTARASVINSRNLQRI